MLGATGTELLCDNKYEYTLTLNNTLLIIMIYLLLFIKIIYNVIVVLKVPQLFTIIGQVATTF